MTTPNDLCSEIAWRNKFTIRKQRWRNVLALVCGILAVVCFWRKRS